MTADEAPPGGRHPDALAVVALGMLAIMCCGVTGPFAWRMGDRVLGEINESGRTIGGYEMVAAGRLCGMLGSGFLALGAIFAVVALVALFFAGL